MENMMYDFINAHISSSYKYVNTNAKEKTMLIYSIQANTS